MVIHRFRQELDCALSHRLNLHPLGLTKFQKMWIAAEFMEFFQPQSKPQTMMSGATSAYFGSPRGLVSSCKTYSCCSETAALGNVRSITVAISSAALNTTMTHARLCIP